MFEFSRPDTQGSAKKEEFAIQTDGLAEGHQSQRSRRYPDHSLRGLSKRPAARPGERRIQPEQKNPAKSKRTEKQVQAAEQTPKQVYAHILPGKPCANPADSPEQKGKPGQTCFFALTKHAIR
ncbi:hypothetical protein [Allobaculum sp. Allo2]|uniref:hypothetical protein n=1 Tax=Allobaculum sp. Allo2 TaxID=2853432 RepID=UPI001F6166C4|nr:hypothetical protein [Allobaculum sp. Allo2]UNT92888.1 hypothetical protein KWG61_12605 [Allobaculum sp. Allo2]